MEQQQQQKKVNMAVVEGRKARAHKQRLYSQAKRHAEFQKRRQNSQTDTILKPIHDENKHNARKVKPKEKPAERRAKLEKWRAEREMKKTVQKGHEARNKPMFKVTRFEASDQWCRNSDKSMKKEPVQLLKIMPAPVVAVRKQKEPPVARRSARLAKQTTHTETVKTRQNQKPGKPVETSTKGPPAPRGRQKSNKSGSSSEDEVKKLAAKTIIKCNPVTVTDRKATSSFAPDNFEFLAPGHLKSMPDTPMTPKSASEYLFSDRKFFDESRNLFADESPMAERQSRDEGDVSPVRPERQSRDESDVRPERQSRDNGDVSPVRPVQPLNESESPSEEPDKENIATLTPFMKTPVPLSTKRSASSRRSTAKKLAVMKSPEERLRYLAASPMIEMSRRTPKTAVTTADTLSQSLVGTFDRLTDEDIEHEIEVVRMSLDESLSASEQPDSMAENETRTDPRESVDDVFKSNGSSEYESATDEPSSKRFESFRTSLASTVDSLKKPRKSTRKSLAARNAERHLINGVDMTSSQESDMDVEKTATRRRSRKPLNDETAGGRTDLLTLTPTLISSEEDRPRSKRSRTSLIEKISVAESERTQSPGTSLVPLKAEAAPVQEPVSVATEPAVKPADGEHHWQYFRDLTSRETSRLNTMCDKWETIFADDEGFNEDVGGQIRTVIGQGHLLMAQRFKQFLGLVDQSEFNTGEKPIHSSDLQGFWDMINFQIEDVDVKFGQLDKLRESNWQTETVETKVVKKVVKKPKAVVTKKPAVKSKFAAFRAKIKSSQQNEPTTVTPVVVVMEEPTKDFEGGFFKISSPVRDVRNSPRNLRPESLPRPTGVSPLMKKVLEQQTASPSFRSSRRNQSLNPVTESDEMIGCVTSPLCKNQSSAVTPDIHAMNLDSATKHRRSRRNTPHKTVNFQEKFLEESDTVDFMKYLQPSVDRSVSIESLESVKVEIGNHSQQPVDDVTVDDQSRSVDVKKPRRKRHSVRFSESHSSTSSSLSSSDNDKTTSSATKRSPARRRSTRRSVSSSDNDKTTSSATKRSPARRRSTRRSVSSSDNDKTTSSATKRSPARRRSTRRSVSSISELAFVGSPLTETSVVNLSVTLTPSSELRRVSLPFTPPADGATVVKSVPTDLMNFSPVQDLMVFTTPSRSTRRKGSTATPGRRSTRQCTPRLQ